MQVNINDDEMDENIYRIVPIERLYQLFIDGTNTLVNPSLWEDTYENLTLRSRRIVGGVEVHSDAHKRIYGQCWTTQKASDAMWRIYSLDRKSVRIRTTPRRLFDSLNLQQNNRSQTYQCIGKVKYVSDARLMASLKSMFTEDGNLTFSNAFKSLLIKRWAFKHESEVRLLHLEAGETVPADPIYSYGVDAHELIDQIMIDPRVSYEDYKVVKREIIEATKFTGQIKRSLLYKLPEPLVISIP